MLKSLRFFLQHNNLITIRYQTMNMYKEGGGGGGFGFIFYQKNIKKKKNFFKKF